MAGGEGGKKPVLVYVVEYIRLLCVVHNSQKVSTVAIQSVKLESQVG